MKDGLTQVKELKDKIHEQYIEIQELEINLQQTNSQLADVSKRCIKAIEYIEKNTEIRKSTFYGLPDYEVFNGYSKDVLEILKGVDKE